MPKPFARRSNSLLATACAVTLLLSTPTTVAAQQVPEVVPPEPTTVEDLTNYDVPEDVSLDDRWVDPVAQFGLNSASLAPVPDFDFSTLNQSPIFAAGVESVPTESGLLETYKDRHLRLLQVIDTFDLEIDRVQDEITDLQPTIDDMVDEINVEREHLNRLTDEIDTFEFAIAEFAISAFIGDDTSDEIYFTNPNAELSNGRIITDEVREEQRVQVALRREEFAEREVVVDALVGELDEVRAVRDTLREERALLRATQGEAEDLIPASEDRYRLAMHDRIPEFVAGTDIPLVALNAYVIAARTLETEDPVCGIHWSMLAGIGRIESIHGYFGDSTLDINGNTTTDIHGLPLDGRILSGAEFVTEGTDVPAATGRTEETAILAAPAPEAAPALETAPAAPAPAPTEATEPAPAPAADAPAAEGPAPAEGEAAAAAAAPAAPAPAPVIKRLALILDTDDGVLDGDTVYDRAVGPMQFIPTTWRLFDADGNVDGETDPQNIYDAALASARYLCAASPMTTVAGEQRAYFAYNHDLDYSRNVTNAGQGYRSQLAIESPLQEDLNGALYLGLADEIDEDAAELAELLDGLGDLDLPDWD